MPPKKRGRPTGKKGGKKISCVECGATEGGFEECPICDKWVCDECNCEEHMEGRHPEYMEDMPDEGKPITKEPQPFMKRGKAKKEESDDDMDEETITKHMKNLGLSKKTSSAFSRKGKQLEEEEELSEGSDNYVDEEDLEESEESEPEDENTDFREADLPIPRKRK